MKVSSVESLYNSPQQVGLCSETTTGGHQLSLPPLVAIFCNCLSLSSEAASGLTRPTALLLFFG